MLKRSLWSTASVALLAGVAAHATSARAQSAPQADDMPATTTEADDAGIVAEVVVTARRREENLQKVPQAVSVVNGEVSRLKGQTALADLQLSVPNLTFAATQNMSQFFLRGVGTTFINGGGDPGVAFHQDGVYVSDQTTTNTAMFDVDHVEVLRGPQGALYGRNAVGGAINVIAARPTSEPLFSANAQLGDYGRRFAEAAVSGPLGFANTNVRIAYQLQNRDGYTKNLLAGRPEAPDALDNLHSNAFRVYTQTELPNEGSLDLIYTYYNENDNGAALGVKPTPGVQYATEVFFPGAVPTADPRRTAAQYGDYKVEAENMNVRWIQPLDAMTLTATGNYRTAKQSFITDCDGTAAPGCRYFRPTSGDDYYGDAHLSSPDDARLRWLVGATYQRLELEQKNFVDVYGYFGLINLTNGGKLRTKAWAVYADLRYQLTDTLALNAQIRYNETKKDASQLTIIPQLGLNIQNYTGPGSHLKNAGTPIRLGVEWQATPDVLFYASYATAQKDGAINLGALQPQPVRQEEVKTFEIGEKASFFDHRLVINGALFDSKYDDLQISQIIGQQTVLVNVPKATIRGAELEVTAIPTAGLRLSANAGYLDAEFDEFSNAPSIAGGVGPVEVLNGNQLPYDARWNVNVDAEWTVSIGLLRGAFGVQYAWKDRVYFTEFNTNRDSQAPIGVWNMSASITPDDGPWRVFAWVHNVTDETVMTGTTIYSGASGAQRAVSYAPPRQFAVGLAYTF